MKKILSFCFLAALTIAAISFSPASAIAQSSKKVTKTALTAADTTVFTNMGSKLASSQVTVTKSAGTLGGKVYWEATINGTWVALDSVTLADVSTAQTKVTINTKSGGTPYLSYRYRYAPTGGTATVVYAYLRRLDE